VLLMLMGHKHLPSEGPASVLGQITDRNAQRLLRHLIRRSPTARWDAAKVVSCQWFRTSDFQVGCRCGRWEVFMGRQAAGGQQEVAGRQAGSMRVWGGC